MSSFTNALVVSPLSDGRTWVILRRLGYDVGTEGSGDRVEVERLFMTDFASIPRLFWTILPRWGKYGNAAVIHDWLYWTQERTRLESDRIMLEAMGVLGVPPWQRWFIFHAVRAFGWSAWKRNQWDRRAGFHRVLENWTVRDTTGPERPWLVTRILLRMG